MKAAGAPTPWPKPTTIDRKSTRLNSSHTVTSYAVFCLKKKMLETIIATAGSQQLDSIVVDSIQTGFTSDLDGAAQNAGQDRRCASRQMRFGKEDQTKVL